MSDHSSKHRQSYTVISLTAGPASLTSPEMNIRIILLDSSRSSLYISTYINSDVQKVQIGEGGERKNSCKAVREIQSGSVYVLSYKSQSINLSGLNTDSSRICIRLFMKG